MKKLRWRLESESAKRINAASRTWARSEPGVPILPEDFDRDPWLLNCPNGTLEDAADRPTPGAPREDYITKLCPNRIPPRLPLPDLGTVVDAIYPDDDDEPDR